MEEKGKAVTIKTDGEEEDFQTMIIIVEEEEDVEEDIQSLHSAVKLPAYVPLRKGKTKVQKDLDATKSSLQTPLLPNGIIFEGTHLGRIPTIKFEDWDLTNSEKFPHLEMETLMKQNTKGGNDHVRATKMAAQCGKGQVNALVMDTTFPPCTHHHLRHQVAAIPSA